MGGGEVAIGGVDLGLVPIGPGRVGFRDAVGAENFFLFGLTVEEIEPRRVTYDPQAIIDASVAALRASVGAAAIRLSSWRCSSSISPEDQQMQQSAGQPEHCAVQKQQRRVVSVDMMSWFASCQDTAL